MHITTSGADISMPIIITHLSIGSALFVFWESRSARFEGVVNPRVGGAMPVAAAAAAALRFVICVCARFCAHFLL